MARSCRAWITRLPKTLPGEVFAQWIDPANLALLDERDRTIVLVLAFTGFRVSSVVTLMRDCAGVRVRRAPVSALFQRQGQARGDAADPAAARRAARAPGGVSGRALPASTEWLFPSRLRRGAKRGAFHIDPETVNLVIERYVRKAEIRTADGKLALDCTRTCSATTSGPAWSTRTFR